MRAVGTFTCLVVTNIIVCKLLRQRTWSHMLLHRDITVWLHDLLDEGGMASVMEWSFPNPEVDGSMPGHRNHVNVSLSKILTPPAPLLSVAPVAASSVDE